MRFMLWITIYFDSLVKILYTLYYSYIKLISTKLPSMLLRFRYKQTIRTHNIFLFFCQEWRTLKRKFKQSITKQISALAWLHHIYSDTSTIIFFKKTVYMLLVFFAVKLRKKMKRNTLLWAVKNKFLMTFLCVSSLLKLRSCYLFVNLFI